MKNVLWWVLVLVIGCQGEATTASSASASGSGAPAEAKGGAKAGDTKTSLKQKAVDDALKSAFGLERMSDPIDKKLADLEGKIGKPVKKEGDYSYWYAIGEPGESCYELKLSTKDGSYEMGGTDKSKCGL